jgi:ubiquitin carboxyl-terminal hydrolase 14
VKYPFDLDLFEFCTDNLKQKLIPARLRMKELEDEKATSHYRTKHENEMTTDPPPSDQQDALFIACKKDVMKPTGWYHLFAVLTHMGRSADSGHYIAWVRSQHDKDIWWKFDDDIVAIWTVVVTGTWLISVFIKSISYPYQTKYKQTMFH